MIVYNSDRYKSGRAMKEFLSKRTHAIKYPLFFTSIE